MTRVFVLLMDAASPDLIERWTDDGTLPHLRQLRERGAYGRMESVAGILAEATPYVLFSSRNPAVTGLHCWAMWQKETMMARPPGKDWLPYQPFWRIFDESGPRAIVVDPPNVYPPEPFHGVELVGWATRDALTTFRTHPPELAAEIRGEFGSGLQPDEIYGLVSKRAFLEDRDRLLEIGRRFTALSLNLMRKNAWELYLGTTFLGHDAGHRLWSAVNVKDRLSKPEEADLNDSLRQAYVAMDEILGKLLAEVDDQTVVLVLSVHGMDVNSSRSWIFPDMLRLVQGLPVSTPGLMERLRRLVPVNWRHAVKSLLPFAVRRGLTRFWRMQGHDWETTRAFALFSDTQGWVRINLKGREARGIVEAGEEYERLCAEIANGLLTFVDADTREPIIRDVIRPQQIFKGEHAADLPDLVVRWADTPARMHRAVSSPKYGEIPWPTPGHNPEGRSGGHREQGMLIAAGPGVKAGTIDNASIYDIAPTILSLLGQPIPAEMEGKPLRLVQ